MLLDPTAYLTLSRQRADGPEDGPLRFHALIDQWARERTGKPAEQASVRAILRPDSVLLAWHPTQLVLMAALAGRLVYLYWGGR